MNLQPDDMQGLQAAATTMGLELPSMAYIVGSVVFSLIGWAAWRYGKKQEQPRVKWLGLGLMLYSYVAYETWVLYLVGIGLCVALYAWRHE